jgi:hypothetical protein
MKLTGAAILVSRGMSGLAGRPVLPDCPSTVGPNRLIALQLARSSPAPRGADWGCRRPAGGTGDLVVASCAAVLELIQSSWWKFVCPRQQAGAIARSRGRRALFVNNRGGCDIPLSITIHGERPHELALGE